METPFEQLLIQNISAVSMAVVFIFYLTKKDKETKATFDSFNRTIQNHLQHALKVELQISKALNHLSECINSLSRQQENRNRTIDRRRKTERSK